MAHSAFDPGHENGDTGNGSTDSKIIASLERISQAFRVLLWEESKAFSLSPIQVQLLIFLLRHPGDKCRITYLAEEFDMTKATISDTVKTLENKGLIVKEYDAYDNRSYIIRLSAEGLETAKKTARFAQVLRPPLAKISDAGKEALLLNLMDIIYHLHREGVITVQRMCRTCVYYRPEHRDVRHYCSLLNKPLEGSELRIDCEEHVPA